jgi:hypothetical protein
VTADVTADVVPTVEAVLGDVVSLVEEAVSEIVPLVIGRVLPTAEDELQNGLTLVGDVNATVSEIKTTLESLVGSLTDAKLQEGRDILVIRRC